VNTISTQIDALINAEIEAIRKINVTDAIAKALDVIHQKVHVEGGKVIVCGMGKAGQIGHTIATTLSSTGTPAIFLHPSEAQHGDLGLLQAHDLLFLISNSGHTREIIELKELARELVPEIKIIGLTGNPDSPVGSFSDVLLETGNPPEICPLGLTPTTSTTTMSVVGDILVVLLMERIGFTKEDYARRHHSGYLGTKARNE